MKNLNGRTVTYVKLHGTEAFIPGIGGLGTTLPSPNKSLNVHMEHTEAGLYIQINNKVEITIPWANVQLAVYKSESGLKVVPTDVA